MYTYLTIKFFLSGKPRSTFTEKEFSIIVFKKYNA